jgi:hypothetical protein
MALLALAWASVLICTLIFLLRIAANQRMPGRLTANQTQNLRVATALALLLAAPLVASLQGCGGGTSSAPQNTSVVTPAGTSILVITPTASNAAGQPLQLPPIKLTLVVHS